MEGHGKLYLIEYYTTPEGESLVDEFFDNINETHQGKIRELRVAIAHHQYRFLYFSHGKTIVITHGFLKKTDKVPQTEIERAKRYMADWMHYWRHKEGSDE